MYKRFLRPLAIGALSLSLAGPIAAGTSMTEPKVAVSPDDLLATFHRGALELQVAFGTELSSQETSELRPNIDYGLAVVRLGYMLDNVRGRGFLRGNDEVMIEAIGGPIYTGPGSALGGLCVMYRHNFVPGAGRFVPYLNVGAGGIYSDASHQRVQRALGSPFEFDLQAGAGLRYRLNPRWSLDGEISYRHLSNADIAPRNYGTNALGGLLGASYAF